MPEVPEFWSGLERDQFGGAALELAVAALRRELRSERETATETT